MARLLERDVIRGVTHEQDRDEQSDHGDTRAECDHHIARGELGGQPAAGGRRSRDAAISGRLVEPEREPAPARPDEVDLHHHGHRPRQPLVGAEQDVRRDDPGPRGSHGDHQRHGQREQPAGDQKTPPADPLGERAGAEVAERLREPESDDERQHRRFRRQPEVLGADQRQCGALEPYHRADERVERDEQRELGGVLA
jgi:hypothetical protein